MTTHKLLLVCPDQAGASMATSMLRPLGLPIDEAEDDRVAARRLDHGPLVLLSVVNPSDPDALELLVFARRRHPGVPVVLLCRGDDAALADQAFELGAAAVLPFPCQPGALRGAVTGVLQRVQTAAPARPPCVGAARGACQSHVLEASPAAETRKRRASRFSGAVGVAEEAPPPRTTREALIPLKKALEGPERNILLEALRVTNWNRREAARALQINRTTLYKKLKKYGLLSAGPGPGEPEDADDA